LKARSDHGRTTSTTRCTWTDLRRSSESDRLIAATEICRSAWIAGSGTAFRGGYRVGSIVPERAHPAGQPEELAHIWLGDVLGRSVCRSVRLGASPGTVLAIRRSGRFPIAVRPDGRCSDGTFWTACAGDALAWMECKLEQARPRGSAGAGRPGGGQTGGGAPCRG
jgi:hypothetical protein